MNLNFLVPFPPRAQSPCPLLALWRLLCRRNSLPGILAFVALKWRSQLMLLSHFLIDSAP
jgi:hypothetical protein